MRQQMIIQGSSHNMYQLFDYNQTQNLNKVNQDNLPTFFIKKNYQITKHNISQ